MLDATAAGLTEAASLTTFLRPAVIMPVLSSNHVPGAWSPSPMELTPTIFASDGLPAMSNQQTCW